MQGGNTASPTVQIPGNAGGNDLHIVLEMRDSGSPSLFAYRRAIINVE